MQSINGERGENRNSDHTVEENKWYFWPEVNEGRTRDWTLPSYSVPVKQTKVNNPSIELGKKKEQTVKKVSLQGKEQEQQRGPGTDLAKQPEI